MWVPKYRRAVLSGEVAIRVRDLPRQMAAEHELEIVREDRESAVTQIPQWLKGISSRVLLQEIQHVRKKFWGRHLWGRGYLADSSAIICVEPLFFRGWRPSRHFDISLHLP